MQPDAILIITEEFDPHADRIIGLLNQRDERVVRFHTADFPVYDRVSFTCRNGILDGILRLPTRELRLDEVKSTWIRRPAGFQFAPQLSENDLFFARREAHHALFGLWGLLDCLWVNSPFADRATRYKLLQLREAAKVGLQVPPTLVTNEPNVAERFYSECQGRMIHKTLGLPYVTDDENNEASKMIYTNFVDPKNVGMERISFCPSLFQPYIEKDAELRVTVIGEQVYACEIQSQKSANPQTRIDWRHYSLKDTPHLAVDLPTPVEQACRQLMRNLGLQFGAIDLIRQPGGEYVFLEINSQGQFIWVERLSGLPLSEAMADLLARGKTGTDPSYQHDDIATLA